MTEAPTAALAASPQPWPSQLLVPKPYRVVDRVTEAGDITSLHVVPADGSPLPSFRPAQCGMLGAFGVGEAAISISSAVTERNYHAYTIRRVGPISGALVDTPVGGRITVRAPFGEPWPIDQITGGQLLIVGGGLGLAPLRAVLHEAVDRIGDFDRVGMVYGAKRPDQLVFRHDLEQWRGAGVDLAMIVDRAVDEAGDPTPWDGPVGVVPDLLGSDGSVSGVNLDWSDTTALVCGPDIMMHFTAQRLLGLGVSEDRIWLTLERNMQCGNALCGHCQLGPFIVCRDGPVVRYDRIARFFQIPQL